LKNNARPRESVAMKAILKLQNEEKKSIEDKIEVQDQRQDKIKQQKRIIDDGLNSYIDTVV
jgi:hypothetical protein